jgi:outer membrane receptor protein involved in Fe transport
MLKRTVVARSIAVAFGVMALGAGVAPSAFAQSNTTGSISGQVASAAGTEVVVENTATGLKRSTKPDASGRYSFVSLPTGTYSVTLTRNGAVVEKRSDVEVRISSGTDISFGTGTTTIEIRGSAIRKLDLSAAGSTTTFSAKDLERIPVASNIGAVIQLAPNTTRGDSRYGGGNAPSFGGAGASENAYYINGFPVTSMLTQVGFSQLPFNSIAQFNVLTGGYGAEFGRSTGGVVNIITKRGGNDFEVGGAISYEPRKLRAKEKDQYYANNGQPLSNGQSLDGKLYFYNGLNTQDRTVVSAYGSGAIVKDKLFFFAGVEQTKTNRDSIRTANTSSTYVASAASQSTAFNEIITTIPRYLVKLDFALTENHNFEYTRISDEVKQDRNYYGFNYATLQRTNVQNGGQSYKNWGPNAFAQQGAVVDILKYTGYLTNDLSVTAVAGQVKSEHKQTPVGYNPAFAQVSAPSAARAPGITYNEGAQTIAGSLLPEGAFDRNKGLRVDVEWKLNSSHTLRAGVDYNRIDSFSGADLAGSYQWLYGKTDPAIALNVGTRPTNTLTGNTLAQQGYYVQKVYSTTGARPQVDQNAQYIEDKWQVNKDLLLILGLRNEGFNNKAGAIDPNDTAKPSYIELKKQIAPRFSATWDPIGDQQTKVFGSLGRYHVPLPTNVAIRAAGASLNTTQTFGYTGVDANGVPTGTAALGNPYSPNNEYGQAKNPVEVASKGIKGNYQDELALGIERALVPGITAGAKVTYRALKTVLDDHCDDRPFYAWAARNGITVSNDWHYNCALFNPGLDNRFSIDLNLDGRTEDINLTAAQLGIIKPKRNYLALDLFVEKQFDGKWGGKVTYTYSKNYGNAEGQVKSDIGQGDVATTQDYDFPEFSVNANGLLPNNRTHKLKAFGIYQITSEFGIGGATVLSSGRPKNCIGNAPSTPALETPFVPGVSPVTNYSGYGSAYFFCKGQPSPRGSAGTLPYEFAVDANFTYSPDWAKGLKIKLDVINLFNRQVAETVEERYNAAGGSTNIRTTYDAVLSYSAPRSGKITVSYDKKF